MTQEIEKLTRLIYGSLSPRNLPFVEQAKQEALQVTAQLQVLFMVQYHASFKKKLQVRYVQAVQSFCVQMANLVQQYRELLLPKKGFPAASKSDTVFYGSLQNGFLQVLDFLTGYFEEEINLSQQVPRCKQTQVSAYFSQQLAELETTAGDIVNKSLIGFLQEYIGSITTAPLCNYGTFIFWQNCFNRLQKEESVGTETWINILVSHNFNDPRFTKWLMGYWKKETVHLSSVSEQAVYWTEKSNWLDKMHPITRAMHPALPACVQLLQDAIDIETGILRSETTDPAHLPDKPIETNLSVSQLGLFLRLQVDTNMIRADNKAELIRQVAAQYKTTRVTGISGDNLYKKFYTCDPAAISIMRTYLSDMLNQLKRY